MYCHKCGQKILDEAKFCSSCGTPIESENIITEEKTSEKTWSTSTTIRNEERPKADEKIIRANSSCRSCIIVAIVLFLLMALLGRGCFSVGNYVYRQYYPRTYSNW